MSNKEYRKGARKEYKIIKNLKNENYDIAQRSAGSHSPIDVWAINIKDKHIKLIQAKPDNYSIAKTEALYAENEGLNGTYEVEFVVI